MYTVFAEWAFLWIPLMFFVLLKGLRQYNEKSFTEFNVLISFAKATEEKKPYRKEVLNKGLAFIAGNGLIVALILMVFWNFPVIKTSSFAFPTWFYLLIMGSSYWGATLIIRRILNPFKKGRGKSQW